VAVQGMRGNSGRTAVGVAARLASLGIAWPSQPQNHQLGVSENGVIQIASGYLT